MHVHEFACTRKSLRTYVRASMSVTVCVITFARLHAYACICIVARVGMCAYCEHVWLCVRVHVYMRARVRASVRACVHAHVCSLVRLCQSKCFCAYGCADIRACARVPACACTCIICVNACYASFYHRI